MTRERVVAWPGARGYASVAAGACLGPALLLVAPRWDLRVIGLLSVVAMVLIVRRSRRIEVRLTPTALVVRNFWSDHALPWARISGSRVRVIQDRNGNRERMVVILDNGQEVQLEATTIQQEPWNDRMYRLRRDLADYGAFQGPTEP